MADRTRLADTGWAVPSDWANRLTRSSSSSHPTSDAARGNSPTSTSAIAAA